MNNTQTEIVLVTDKSGSMYGLRRTVVNALNEFINTQKSGSGTAHITLCTFNDSIETMLKRCPAAEAPAITTEQYEPDGCTALLDAIGHTIDETGKQLAAMPEEERPGSVIIGIMTDGYENSSQHYDWDAVRQRVLHQKEKYSWKFMFFGATSDAFEVADRLGIDRNDTVIWNAADKEEVDAMMHAQSRRIHAHRAMAMNEASEADRVVLKCCMSSVMNSFRKKKK